ncbi:hypothetical protein [Ralstonia syzygii]|uniref:Uncharacterized protein n=1 Tax=Ralstonia syzygii R24 TaxID=907261 RepID=G3A3U2_9RALS|nr:hypothetical protein [Ralstonia syzygii]CCA84647.1 conserved hypothetical protein [Ralstonia syzygii R24]CCA88553.1 conserved hypothetical protein [Ralstonia syzygii R24]
MTAKKAAEALLMYDADVTERYREVMRRDERSDIKNAGYEEWKEFAFYLKGLWTLSMVAHAAGVTEEQVVAALLKEYGTVSVARGITKLVFA